MYARHVADTAKFQFEFTCVWLAMYGKEARVFQSFITELKDILASEKICDQVANTLYQNKGIVSLEYVLDLKNEKNEIEKAQKLLSFLEHQITADKSYFERITSELETFAKLQPVIQKMKEKLCKLTF